MKVERNRAGNKYTFTAENKEDEKFLDKVNKKIDELEKENENLNDYWNITQRTMKDYEDMIDELNDKLNKIKDLFNKRDMTGKDEFLEELRDLLRD